jgi:hypothetical protein
VEFLKVLCFIAPIAGWMLERALVAGAKMYLIRLMKIKKKSYICLTGRRGPDI